MLKLYYNLFREKRSIGPNAQFKRSLHKKLQGAWDEYYQTRYAWYQTPAFRYVVVIAVVLIFMSTTGVGAYAYNSTEVTEGTILYPVKRAIERVEEKVVQRRVPEARARFYLKQTERRKSEEKVIMRRKQGVEQIKKVDKKLNLNLQPYEKSNPVVSGGDGRVGNGNAGTSSGQVRSTSSVYTR